MLPTCAAELARNATCSPNPESFSHKVQGPALYFWAYYKSNFLTSTKLKQICSRTYHHAIVISLLDSPLPSTMTLGQNTWEGTRIICFLSEGSIPFSYLSLFFCSWNRYDFLLAIFLPTVLWRKDWGLKTQLWFLSFIAKNIYSNCMIYFILFNLSF